MVLSCGSRIVTRVCVFVRSGWLACANVSLCAKSQSKAMRARAARVADVFRAAEWGGVLLGAE